MARPTPSHHNTDEEIGKQQSRVQDRSLQGESSKVQLPVTSGTFEASSERVRATESAEHTAPEHGFRDADSFTSSLSSNGRPPQTPLQRSHVFRKRKPGGHDFQTKPTIKERLKALIWSVAVPQSMALQYFKVAPTPQSAVQAVVLVLCIIAVIDVPFLISFESRIKPPGMLLITDSFLCCIELCFMADVFVNFRTAYYSTEAGAYITDRKAIAWSYAKGMLLLDLVSSAPVTIWSMLSMDFSTRHVGNFGPVTILQLLKMLKVTSLRKLTVQVEAHFGSAWVSFGRLIFVFCLIFHVTACGFHLIAMLGDESMSWVAMEHLHEASSGTRYVAALYWTFATISTTGFGDIVPVTNLERVYSMGGMLLGLTIFSYFIAAVSHVISVINASSVRAANQRQVIDMFAEQHRLPRNMHEEIQAYFDYLHRNTTTAHDTDNALIEKLSPQLRMDLRLYLYADVVCKIPCFKTKTSQFIAEIIPKLACEVFPPEEYIVTEGEFGSKLYFVRAGFLEVRVAWNRESFQRACMLAQSMKSRQSISDHLQDRCRQYMHTVSGTVRNRPVATGILCKGTGITPQNGSSPSKSSHDNLAPPLRTNDAGHATTEAKTGKVRGGTQSPIPKTAACSDQEGDESDLHESDPHADLSWAHEVLQTQYVATQHLHSGDFFGERACLQGMHRAASVVSLQYSETLSLSKGSLDEVEARFGGSPSPKGCCPDADDSSVDRVAQSLSAVDYGTCDTAAGVGVLRSWS